MTQKQAIMLSYTVIFEPSPKGGFNVYIPALPDCEAHGKTLEDAKKSASKAIREFVGELQRGNERIPHDIAAEPVVEKATVRIKDQPHTYTSIFEPAVEGGYVVHVPALIGAVTEGITLTDAREMVKDMIEGYLQSLIKHNEPIPSDISEKPVFDRIRIPEPIVSA